MKLSAADESLLEALFATIDRQDAAAFAEFLTPDARFRFGSAPAATGRSAIETAVGGFFESIAGLSHRIDKAVRDSNSLICEGEVTYTRHDGSQVSLPFADVFEMAGTQIASYKIYMDVSPLYGG